MKKIMNSLSLFLCMMFFSSNILAENLFQITLLRASPGNLPSLIETVKQLKSAQNDKMVIMRHSQGDHWDLMLLSPADRTIRSTHIYQHQVNFQHDFLTSSKANWQQIKQLSINTGLFHIEMFNAASGKYQKLLEQRHMENQYLQATERNANLIFETQFGNDVDLLTIGFYPDLPTFATDPDLDSKIFEKAAKDAGFKSRSDIGFYLRQFIVSHQDTLATQIQ